ncbi:MAG: membrane protein insertion efficiency factor YidD [Proteobacteria bacterium]|nr:membrane protein insertion efficiency factor YidD [Pseudomonadota bacterium]MCH9027402.1 membrane protein insertion efficiency factor YidD [Pseudomonadota bacterium]
MRRVMLFVIDIYRWFLSPLLGSNCRYYPSCSHFARDAIRIHGALRGSLLAAQRIGRCHPWADGGYDPVPAKDIKAFNCNG